MIVHLLILVKNIYIGYSKNNVNNNIKFLNDKYKIKENNIISVDKN